MNSYSPRSLVLLLVVFVLAATSPLLALDPQYLRNGECYLLLGDGGTHQGVYRLNNPSGDPVFVGRLYNPGLSIGIAVDLDRNVFTFSEAINPGYLPLSTPIPRQVVDDTVTENIVDFGAHAYIHMDHRGAGETTKPVYRTGPVGRGILRNGGGVWGTFVSGGPGTSMGFGMPANTFLPPTDTIRPAREWYSIPNGSWYSSWDTAPTDGGSHPWGNYSYKVYRDSVEGKAHNWTLMAWKDSYGIGNPPVASGAVGTSYDLKIARNILNGCLDGCGGAVGGGSWDAKPRYTSVGFMPPTRFSVSRTYLYSREKDTGAYTITVAPSGSGPSPYTGSIIGYPADVGVPVERGTRWVGVSTRNNTQEWVYALGTRVIKDWYFLATGFAAPAAMAIESIAVSNQWNQLGGIVYAYDRTSGIAYKFARDETSGTPITALGYEPIPLGNDIDDVKADGFGSLFFAKTTAAPTPVDPTPIFDLDRDVVGVIPGSISPPFQYGRAICAQSFQKEVFERRVTDGIINPVGTKPIGYKYFAKNFLAPPAVVSALSTAPFTGFSSRLIASGGSWLAWGTALPEWPDTVTSLDRTELAVINVPTPPRVLSFPGYASHLDIIGAYTAFPAPNNTARHTNQSANLLGATSILSNGNLYFFMVENYPLVDGAQDPTLQPNWNGNSFSGTGYTGGFVSTVTDPRPTTSGGEVDYTWTLWTVEDSYGQVMTPAPYIDTAKSYAFGFFSPVGGKYILTCRVKYNWYNYDLLPYGSVFSDRSTVLVSNTYAQSQGKTDLVNAIKTTPGFSFMNWASMSTELVSNIIPDDTYAAFPINVTGNATPPTWPLFITAIERCDIASDTGATVWSATATHNVYANLNYAWRVALASQTNLMNPNIATDSTTWLRQQLINPASPLYANNDPRLVFRNNSNEVRWIDTDVQFTGTIVATMPDSTRSQLPVFGGSTSIRSAVATYGIGPIPYPTDPVSGLMEIKANRMFAYKLWPYDAVRGIYYPPFEMQAMITLTGQCNVCSIDHSPPTLAESFTTPRNLFGFTGDPIVTTALPDGVSNPSQMEFVIGDNNPFENGTTTGDGLTTSGAWISNRNHNALYNGRSNYGLRKMFARIPNRKTTLHYQSAVDPATLTSAVGMFNNTFDASYTARFASAPIFLSWSRDNNPGAATTTAYIRHILGVTNLAYTRDSANKPTNRLPVNYANNFPGYQPLGFEVSITDSSGNAATYTLNCAMNIRDNQAPIAWASIIDRKNNARKVFPALAPIGNAPFIEAGSKPVNGAPMVSTWTSNAAGYFGNFADFPTPTPFGAQPKMLKSLGATVVSPFSDAELIQQIKDGVDPQYLEDNVEFEMNTYVNDNAGLATSVMSVAYPLPGGGQATWVTSSARPWPPALATGAAVVGVIRGLPTQFPIGCPIIITAQDNAVRWTYYIDSTTGTQNWRTDQPHVVAPATPAASPNSRTIQTVLPVYDSRMLIRTLEKSIENH